jgi:DNA-binding Lrp family transcriptional regulator
LFTRKQKEILVIQLYQQGKTIREIAKEVHMSFSRISQVIKRFEGVNFGEEVPVSKETKALKLFSEGKNPVFVAIELDMKIDEIKRLYLEYLNMNGLNDLTKFYYEQGDQFLPFVQFYNNLRSKGISTLKVIGLAELVHKVSQIETNLKEKSDRIQGMLQQQQSIVKEIYRLQDILTALQKYISWLDFVSHNKQLEIQYRSNEIENLKNKLTQ